MGLKLLILSFALISLGYAQNVTESSLTCRFSDAAVGYSCNLQFNNSQGRDDFTEIQGVHLEGFTNADVRVILSTTGRTINVPQIICSQFPNLEYLDLTNLGIITVSEGAFSACSNLRWLRLWNNQIWQLPANVFNSNQALTYLDLDSNSLNSIPEGLFTPLVNLETLELANNFLSNIPENTFSTLTNLTVLLMQNCGLRSLNPAWFATLTRLEQLNIYRNWFTEIEENTFENLSNLLILDISTNLAGGLRSIHSNAFRNLVNLRQLNINSVGLTELHASWFETLTSLNYLYLSFNRIQEIPQDCFRNLGQLRSLSLWNNQLKIIRRNSFGFLGNLTFLDLEQNGLNALDQRFIDEAVELRTVYLSNNVCASTSFFDVINNREVFMQRLRNCFCNFLHYVEVETGNEFITFRAFNPGMAFRVNGTDNIAITLMPVDFIATPRISVLLGINNGTTSAIRVNGQEDVVSLNTPNILEANRWNDFRITWANWMILVYREQQQFPFMAWNMREIYPITNYAVRSPNSRANWNIQPLELPADIDTC